MKNQQIGPHNWKIVKKNYENSHGSLGNKADAAYYFQYNLK